jgi:ProP effector
MSNASLKEQLQAMASQLGDQTALHNQQHVSTQGGSKINKPRNHIKKTEKSGQNKPKWLEYAQYGVELLKAYFPLAFKEIQEIAPLKKGIKQDLVKRLGSIDSIVIEDKACMIKSLAYYVNTNAYHKAMKEGSARLDLDGQAVETVTQQEMQYAKDRLDGKHKARPIHNKTELPFHEEAIQ